jgi:hypothetical protein
MRIMVNPKPLTATMLLSEIHACALFGYEAAWCLCMDTFLSIRHRKYARQMRSKARVTARRTGNQHWTLVHRAPTDARYVILHSALPYLYAAATQ